MKHREIQHVPHAGKLITIDRASALPRNIDWLNCRPNFPVLDSRPRECSTLEKASVRQTESVRYDSSNLQEQV